MCAGVLETLERRGGWVAIVVVCAYGDHGCLGTHRLKKARRGRVPAAVMRDLDDLSVDLGLLFEQPALRPRLGVSREKEAGSAVVQSQDNAVGVYRVARSQWRFRRCEQREVRAAAEIYLAA